MSGKRLDKRTAAKFAESALGVFFQIWVPCWAQSCKHDLDKAFFILSVEMCFPSAFCHASEQLDRVPNTCKQFSEILSRCFPASHRSIRPGHKFERRNLQSLVQLSPGCDAGGPYQLEELCFPCQFHHFSEYPKITPTRHSTVPQKWLQQVSVLWCCQCSAKQRRSTDF